MTEDLNDSDFSPLPRNLHSHSASMNSPPLIRLQQTEQQSEQQSEQAAEEESKSIQVTVDETPNVYNALSYKLSEQVVDNLIQ